jgi:hypothetical protein
MDFKKIWVHKLNSNFFHYVSQKAGHNRTYENLIAQLKQQ